VSALDPERMKRVTARLALACRHEAMALELSDHFDRGSVTKAAAHFAVADALRARGGRA